MPSRLCLVCKQVVPSSEFESHRQAHRAVERPRKGTTAPWRRLRRLILIRDGEQCVECGSLEELEVHHIDGDWENDDPSNLETRCFEHNPRGRRKGTVVDAVSSKLTSS